MPIETKIRKSGGAAILTIPKPVLQYLNAEIGSTIEVDMSDGVMICTKKVDEEITLQSLLDSSPRKNFELNEEDKEWLHADPVGSEL